MSNYVPFHRFQLRLLSLLWRLSLFEGSLLCCWRQGEIRRGGGRWQSGGAILVDSISSCLCLHGRRERERRFVINVLPLFFSLLPPPPAAIGSLGTALSLSHPLAPLRPPLPWHRVLISFKSHYPANDPLRGRKGKEEGEKRRGEGVPSFFSSSQRNKRKEEG